MVRLAFSAVQSGAAIPRPPCRRQWRRWRIWGRCTHRRLQICPAAPSGRSAGPPRRRRRGPALPLRRPAGSPHRMLWPMLRNTCSQGTVIGIGLVIYWGRSGPFSSNTETHRFRTMPVTWPALASRISFGPQPQQDGHALIFAPRLLPRRRRACVSRGSRQYIGHFCSAAAHGWCGPRRWPRSRRRSQRPGPPRATFRLPRRSCKKSTAVITPAASSPGTPALRPSWQPMAT